MAFAVKYRMTHKEKIGTATVTSAVEILEDGFAGSVTDVRAGGDMFRLEYQKISARRPFESPIQMGRLELYLMIRGTGTDATLGYDGLSIYNEVYDVQEDTYRMRLKIDGDIVFTGSVLNDLNERPIGQYAYTATIAAKDLTRLSGMDFPVVTAARESIISTIAFILGQLGYDLPIHTYTVTVASEMTLANDFLDEITNDRRALKTIASNGDEQDQPITHMEALERVLRSHGLILRQDTGVWRIYEPAALDTPVAVQECIYNSSGVQQSRADTDLTFDVDRLSKFILPRGVARQGTTLKRCRATYDHRSTVGQLKLPSAIYLDGLDSEQYSNTFISTGSQQVEFGSTLTVKHNSLHDAAHVDGILTAGQYYFDGTQWTETASTVTMEISSLGGIQDGSDYLYRGAIGFTTPAIPSDATSPMEITIPSAEVEAGPNEVADHTEYTNISFNVTNPSNTDAGSSQIIHQLTQDSNWSITYDHGTIYFGDGPSNDSPGALGYGLGGAKTGNDWQRRGSTAYRNRGENLLKGFMDLQRVSTLLLDGTLWGKFESHKLPEYDSKNLFFLGGSLTGKGHMWDGSFWEINLTEDA